ncbi:MAG: helix-turn-helix transcriptional regulator [Alistipes sp.]|nr:helix-turn-helix transcriptional regulator [Alistipes sp.]
MREKLLILMKTEGLTSSRLAELLGIQPSGISHILGGRNKPSFDFVQKILRRFPKINPDWLLLDSEQMYREQGELNEYAIQNQSAETSSLPSAAGSSDNISTPPTLTEQNPSAQNSHIPTNGPIVEKISNSQKAIKRVIILYTDRTFESYEE